MSHDSLGDRMKGYESAARTVLPGRMPIIIRVDGKAFHTYTRGSERPFDKKLGDVMIDTAKHLCENIQGAQMAYTQSDEISILVHGYKKFDTSAWFDNQVQKMASVAGGLASSHFSVNSYKIWAVEQDWTTPTLAAQRVPHMLRPAVFDARVFIVPEADVCNYFLWRQQDATRNSVQMLARTLFSHKLCENKNNSELKQMCLDRGVDWFSIEPRWQRGVCVQKIYTEFSTGVRSHWEVDYKIPVFSQDRDYINNHLKLEEE